jgi:hypothetical protein
MVEQGITVFVLPLIALIEDWERRLKHLGLEYERFGGSENPELKGNSKIILVTSDMAKRPEWKTAIAILDQRCPVLRTRKSISRKTPNHFILRELLRYSLNGA